MKILYFSYFYPPLSGPATFRNAKVVKYLAEYGAIIDVISVGETEYLNQDENLLNECGHRKLIRSASFDLMSIAKKLSRRNTLDSRNLYLNTSEKIKKIVRSAIPVDDKIGWLPGLISAGIKAINDESYDFIYVSCGPFSSAIGAYNLSMRSGIPMVVDYRDYWTQLNDYLVHLTPLHKALARYWEKKILNHATLVISATKGIGLDLVAGFGEHISAKLHTLYNGWDESDFGDVSTHETKDEYEIAYFGAIYARRTLKHFYQAVSELRSQGLLPTNTIVRLYGNYFVETHKEIANSGISDIVEIVPQLEHKEALKRMSKASLLLLLINSSSPYGTLTSKVFEYLRVQKPILAMIPANKEAAILLKSCNHDYLCAMESVSSIRNALLRAINGRNVHPSNYIIPYHYERSRQIKALSDRLQNLCLSKIQPKEN